MSRSAWRDLIWPRALPEPRAPAGMIHRLVERDGRHVRYHLRTESDGSALLVAGASEAVRLPPLAAAAAHALLEGDPTEREAALERLGDRARRDRPPWALRLGGQPSTWRDAVDAVATRLDELGRPGARFPVFNLDDTALAGATGLVAPFQADLVLAVPCDAATVRRLLAALWDAGVPHVRFRYPTGLAAESLADLVEHAEDIGLITGLRMPPTDRGGAAVLEACAARGLDYAVVPWASREDAHATWWGQSRDAATGLLRAARRLELCPVAELPLVAGAAADLKGVVESLGDAGVVDVEAWAVTAEDDPSVLPTHALRQVAARVEEVADAQGVRVTWIPPGVRDGGDLAGQLERGPRAGGDVSIRVEADGTVMPPRGPASGAGNLLTDGFAAIWDRPVFRRFRERVESDTRCAACPGLALCAADCPAEARGWASGDAGSGDACAE